MQDDVSLGRSAIDIHSFALRHFLFDEAHAPASIVLQPPSKRFEILQCEPLIELDACTPVVPGKNAVAAAVYIILFNLKDFEPIGFEQILQRLQRVIFQMLVTDIADVVLFQHRGQAHQLGHEGPVLGQGFLRVADELVGVLQVVEHANGRDDLGLAESLLLRQRRVTFIPPEVVQHDVGVLAEEVNQVVSRLAPNPPNPLHAITRQQGSIVGPDVQHHVTGLQWHHLLDRPRDVPQCPSHRIGYAGPVPIETSVQQFLRSSVAQLQQGTFAT
ncbi:MAG: hypothetical protein EWM72_01450 [Nitrospira sp.]|nr:MAG: hypothetical protein EWM72_01450 [Nitrospira sp.]